MGVEVRHLGMRDSDEIERGIVALSRAVNSGLIVTTGAPSMMITERGQ
jgi:hypothetical protein